MAIDHFKSRGFVEGGVIQYGTNSALDIGSLPPFLRTLLVADGTVTKSLEAFFWEKVEVETLDQHLEVLSKGIDSINAKAGDQILKRDVRLHGLKSDRFFAYATSYLQVDALDQEIKENLLAERIGIGELLREIGLETYREIIDLGEEKYVCPDTEQAQQCIYRTYVIHIGGQPRIEISERFPIETYCI